MRTWLVAAGIALAVAASERPPVQEAAATGRVERGRYLVAVAGCGDCHTPLKMGPRGPERDVARLLSGHPEGTKLGAAPRTAPPWMGAFDATMTAFAGPWGTTYATNLTPDANTGIGIWTEEMFFKAMREGKHMGAGRAILPPMGWENLRAMTDEDLKSVFAYLKSLPPVANRVPEWQPPVAPEGPPGK